MKLSRKIATTVLPILLIGKYSALNAKEPAVELINKNVFRQDTIAQISKEALRDFSNQWKIRCVYKRTKENSIIADKYCIVKEGETYRIRMYDKNSVVHEAVLPKDMLEKMDFSFIKFPFGGNTAIVAKAKKGYGFAIKEADGARFESDTLYLIIPNYGKSIEAFAIKGQREKGGVRLEEIVLIREVASEQKEEQELICKLLKKCLIEKKD
ncbi:MAG: hypothetical protein WC492_03120 [Candidatus Micrarchaeia archaeon]